MGGDRWLPVGPLLLVFQGGTQLELAWNHLDELSITWDTVDLAVRPSRFGSEGGWRSSQPAALGNVVGRRLTAIAIVETPYFRGADDLDFSKGLPMHAVAGWTIRALWMEFGDAGLLLFDEIGDLGLASAPSRLGNGNEIRLTPWL